VQLQVVDSIKCRYCIKVHSVIDFLLMRIKTFLLKFNLPPLCNRDFQALVGSFFMILALSMRLKPTSAYEICEFVTFS